MQLYNPYEPFNTSQRQSETTYLDRDEFAFAGISKRTEEKSDDEICGASDSETEEEYFSLMCTQAHSQLEQEDLRSASKFSLLRRDKNALAIYGRSATLYTPDTSLQQASENNLLSLEEFPDILVDRFDVRLLMTNIKEAQRVSIFQRSSPTTTDIWFERTLDKERYRGTEWEPAPVAMETIESLRNQFHVQSNSHETMKNRNIDNNATHSRERSSGIGAVSSNRKFAAVPFNYQQSTHNNSNTTAVHAQSSTKPVQTNSTDSNDVYRRPFAVPKDIQEPNSWKSYLRMAHTARKAAIQPQLEVLLRVRQTGNPLFDFLHDDDSLHSFYTFLKTRAKTDPKAEWPDTPPAIPFGSSTLPSPSGSLLGLDYSSDDSDSSQISENMKLDGSPKKKRRRWDVAESNAVSASFDAVATAIARKKALQLARLERARKLKNHFKDRVNSMQQKSPTDTIE